MRFYIWVDFSFGPVEAPPVKGCQVWLSGPGHSMSGRPVVTLSNYMFVLMVFLQSRFLNFRYPPLWFWPSVSAFRPSHLAQNSSILTEGDILVTASLYYHSGHPSDKSPKMAFSPVNAGSFVNVILLLLSPWRAPPWKDPCRLVSTLRFGHCFRSAQQDAAA